MQLFGDEAQDEQVLDRISQARAHFVRLPVQWRWLEPDDRSPSDYHWMSLDDVALSINRAGMRPFAVLYTRPDWASSDGCGPIDRVPIARYQAYVTALVERYDGDGIDDAPGSPIIRHWEVENEPDFDRTRSAGQPDHGSCFGGARAAAYGTHLRATWQAAKAADPEAVIVFGGVAYERFYNKTGYSPSGPFDYDFVMDSLTALHGAHGSEPGFPFFDWMAVHIYNDFRNNWDGNQPYNQELSAKLSHLSRNQLYRPGSFDLRSKPIAITEVGLSSAPADDWTNRNESLQAAYPGRVLARAMAEGSPAVLWFVGKDRFTGSCNDIYAWQTFGLLRSRAVYDASRACGGSNPLPGYAGSQDNAVKPAHAAFRTAQEMLGGLEYDRRFSTGQTGSNRIEAYRLHDAQSGDYMVVAFTDTGERIGRRGTSTIRRNMVFDAGILPDWTGKIRVTDYRGQSSVYTGSSISVSIGQSPVYVRAE